jgi:uncharacterized protein
VSWQLTSGQTDVAVLACVAELAIARCRAHDAAHDGSHLARVVANAASIADHVLQSGDVVDRFVLEVACWLHDLVQLPKGAGVAGEAARRSASEARAILEDVGVDPGRIDAIARAIEAHSFSGGREADTIEAAILQDADRLDALGAVGIARLWVTGAALGSLLYHPHEPAGGSRELDDRAFAFDHIERKLLRLPDLMTTDAGRAEARRRAAFVSRYRDEFLRELGVDDSDCHRDSARKGDFPVTPESLLRSGIASGAIDAEVVFPGVPTPTVPDAAVALGVSEREIIKSLLFEDGAGRVVLAIVSGTTRVNRQRLAGEIGAGRVKMATPERVLERTGYPAGGTPPVGHVAPLDVVIDRAVLGMPVVYGGGGTVDTLLRIRPSEIVRATGAKVADIAD